MGMMWYKVNIKGYFEVLIQFFFSKTGCLAKPKEPSLPYYLHIAGGGIIGFYFFPRVFVLCEMQSASSRIWTLIAVSISYDDNITSRTPSVGSRYFYSVSGVVVLIRVPSKYQYGLSNH